MGDSRVVLPNTTTLQISRGDWIVIRTQLNAGENKRMLKRGTVQTGAERHIDLFDAGTAKLIAYLLDWSLAGPNGAVIPIRGLDEAAIENTIDSIDPDSYTEILRAIEAHERRFADAREAEKKTIPGGETTSEVTSISPSVAGGVLSGSVS